MRDANEALIVIDLQNDFCPGGALAVAGGDDIVDDINALMSDFQNVILTQDWHPVGHSSFASSHEGAEPFTMTEMAYGPQMLWPDHCVQGSDGARFHAGLKQDAAQMIVRKGFRPGIDSYSAFFENDRTTTTGLAGYLQMRSIQKLILVGLALDYCVAYSAVDGATIGFDVTVETSLSRAIAEESLVAAQDTMHEAGVVLV